MENAMPEAGPSPMRVPATGIAGYERPNFYGGTLRRSNTTLCVGLPDKGWASARPLTQLATFNPSGVPK